MSEELRAQLIQTARMMNEQSINSGSSGNLSVRQDNGMLITPSGIPYSELSVDDIVAVASDGQVDAFARPSSEWRFHHDIYTHRPDVQAVLHAHPSYCTTLACLRRDIPAFHYEVALAGGNNIRCAHYATFGTQDLSDSVIEAMQDRTACLIENHGVICTGDTLEKALALAINIEFLARAYCQCLTIGKPHILSDDEMVRVADQYANYRGDPDPNAD